MIISKALNNFYPDLSASGGLAGVLQSALCKVGSSLVVSDISKPINFIVYSRVESGPRSSQIYIAAEERLFLFDFWARGVCLARGQTTNIADVALAIDKWVASTCSTTDLAGAFTFVVPDKKAAIYERGEEVQDRWNHYVTSIKFPELKSFIEAAFRREKLKQLFPYTSVFTFCFSRCTGYPFTQDTPYVCPQKTGTYQVISPSGAVLGEGNAEQAAELVEANLPPNCGPAVPGTANDLARS